MTAVLEVRDITVDFGGNRALDHVSFSVEPGFTGLIGPNGAGKTTLFNVVSGYVPASEGEVLLDGKLRRRRPSAVARAGVARTFQTPRMVPDLTVAQNVMLGLDSRRGMLGHALEVVAWPSARRAEAEGQESARALLQRFGLDHLGDTAAQSVPLAVQKIVEVARALVAHPRLLLLDEPAAGLAVEDVERLIGPLREIARSTGCAVLIIEHDLALVTELCSAVHVLDFGKLIGSGSPSEVLRMQRVLQAYMGAGFAAASA